MEERERKKEGSHFGFSVTFLPALCFLLSAFFSWRDSKWWVDFEEVKLSDDFWQLFYFLRVFKRSLVLHFRKEWWRARPFCLLSCGRPTEEHLKKNRRTGKIQIHLEVIVICSNGGLLSLKSLVWHQLHGRRVFEDTGWALTEGRLGWRWRGGAHSSWQTT